MQKSLLSLLSVVLIATSLSAQTRLRCQLHDGDYFTSPAEEGIYDIFPDAGTYVRTGSLAGISPWDLDAFGSGSMSYVTDDSRGTAMLVSDLAGFGFTLNIAVTTVGSGRDGFMYGTAWGGSFYRINPVSTSTELLGTGMPYYRGLCTMVNGTMLGVIDTQLYEVDRLTGAGTPILTLATAMSDIACSLDGRLFGMGAMFTSNYGDLFEIDLATGATTFMMDLPFIPSTWNSLSIGSEPGSFVPADSILLSGPTTVSPGSSATYSLSGAPAGSTFALLASTGVAGVRKTIWHGGHPFDLDRHVLFLATGHTDVNGDASIQITVPITVVGTRYLEVGVRAPNGHTYDSNELAVVIQ